MTPLRFGLLITALLVILGPTPVAAGPILYTFAGEGGLSGGFILDDEAMVSSSGGSAPVASGGTLSSPLNRLWGTFGDYDFVGTPTLYTAMYDGLFEENFWASEHWIVRSGVTSSNSAIDSVHLHMWSGVSEISHRPPPINTEMFFYVVTFNDGSFVTKPLQSLVMVPEAPSFLLPMFAFAALAVAQLFVAKS